MSAGPATFRAHQPTGIDAAATEINAALTAALNYPAAGQFGTSEIRAIIAKHCVPKPDGIVLGCVLARQGGAWIGAARRWIQSRFMNGDSVIWGSHDLLKGAPVTVADIEEVAAEAAAAAINEYVGQGRMIR